MGIKTLTSTDVVKNISKPIKTLKTIIKTADVIKTVIKKADLKLVFLAFRKDCNNPRYS